MPPVPATYPRLRLPTLTALRQAVRRITAGVSRTLGTVRREHVLFAVLAAVFLLYLLTLVLEPSAAGRGGR